MDTRGVTGLFLWVRKPSGLRWETGLGDQGQEEGPGPGENPEVPGPAPQQRAAGKTVTEEGEGQALQFGHGRLRRRWHIQAGKWVHSREKLARNHHVGELRPLLRRR